MTCRLCAGLHQFALNIALLADHALNVATLGDPNETVSRRVARAREAGQGWAWVACRILSAVFGRDHCGLALQPGTSGRELWHWSDNDSEPVL